MELDNKYMEQALLLAEQAAAVGEVPVGALVVYDDTVIATARNQVESDFAVTSHAELLVLQKAAKELSNWRLTGCTLYVTLEPCAMCASAIRLSRCSRVVFGAPDIRLGGFGSFVDLGEQTVFGPPPELVSGVLADESSALLKSFFKKRR